MIYLLIKEHIHTGLKYLCKHETNNERTCYTYKGSGIYWRKHIKKHGCYINTICIFKTIDKEKFKSVSIGYSKYFNIVNSKEWANLTIEQGSGGKTITSEQSSVFSKNMWSSESFKENNIDRLRKHIESIRPLCIQGAKDKLTGIQKTEKHKEAMRGKRPHVDQSGSKNNNSKRIVTPFGIFGSIREASLNIEGYTYGMICYRLKLNKEWRYDNY